MNRSTRARSVLSRALSARAPLSPQAWRARHRWVVVVQALCVTALGVALATTHPDDKSVAGWVVSAVALGGAAAGLAWHGSAAGRTLASCSASFGLMASASDLVALTGGLPEAHFAFFALIPFVGMYEAWAPLVVGVAEVLVEHGLIGTLFPGTVFGDPMRMAHPWRFAIIHAAFFAVASIGSYATWQLAEGGRARHEAFSRSVEVKERTDPLSGLGTKAVALAALVDLLGPDQSGKAAVVLVDLDNFRNVNDTLGHAPGDRLLHAVASRLEAVLGEAGVLARPGGDEFIAVLRVTHEYEAEALAWRLVDAVSADVELDGVLVSVTASAGVSTSVRPLAGSRTASVAEELLRRADLALYVSKRAATGVTLFDPAHDDGLPGALSTLGDLRRALEADDELVLYFQPKVAVESGHLVGVEALVRWRHPQLGLVQPSAFVPLVHSTHLAEAFTRYVLAAAVAQIATWAAHGLQISVAVNVSPRCLLQPWFLQCLVEQLDTHRVSPGLVVIEITEDAFMDDIGAAKERVGELHQLGVKVSLDDFGTGYSSLSHLREVRLDELKIDKSFVSTLGGCGGDDTPGGVDEMMVSAIIDLGHRLGMRVVAEGVEDEQQREVLRRLGCDVIQGYLYSRPVPAEELPLALLPVTRNAGQLA